MKILTTSTLLCSLVILSSCGMSYGESESAGLNEVQQEAVPTPNPSPTIVFEEKILAEVMYYNDPATQGFELHGMLEGSLREMIYNIPMVFKSKPTKPLIISIDLPPELTQYGSELMAATIVRWPGESGTLRSVPTDVMIHWYAPKPKLLLRVTRLDQVFGESAEQERFFEVFVQRRSDPGIYAKFIFPIILSKEAAAN